MHFSGIPNLRQSVHWPLTYNSGCKHFDGESTCLPSKGLTLSRWLTKKRRADSERRTDSRQTAAWEPDSSSDQHDWVKTELSYVMLPYWQWISHWILLVSLCGCSCLLNDHLENSFTRRHSLLSSRPCLYILWAVVSLHLTAGLGGKILPIMPNWSSA